MSNIIPSFVGSHKLNPKKLIEKYQADKEKFTKKWGSENGFNEWFSNQVTTADGGFYPQI